MTLTTPIQSGRYIGYWRLRTAEGQNFGHRIWADVLVTGGTADLMAEGSVVSAAQVFCCSTATFLPALTALLLLTAVIIEAGL